MKALTDFLGAWLALAGYIIFYGLMFAIPLAVVLGIGALVFRAVAG